MTTELTTQTLIDGYKLGKFPFPNEDKINWYSPKTRAILQDVHIPKSLTRFIKKCKFTYTIDKAFPEVINACSLRKDKTSSWLTKEFIDTYTQLFTMGIVHSIEVWDGTDLVGGLYGVYLYGVFSGESMFHRKNNASKCAILFLMDHLKTKGINWIDIQMSSKHMSLLGATGITKENFESKLKVHKESFIEIDTM